jgi:hypothetical protein
MRSHFLNELSIDGMQPMMKALPGFDLYNLRRITQFIWTAAANDISASGGAELLLTAIYESPSGSQTAEVVLRCSGVVQLKLPELGPSFFLAEVEIEEISGHQIEGVRYRVKDFGDSSFEVLCRNIDISLGDS